MSKIQILPEETISKIAAGEVVERPASVIKELVENSIDARSKHLAIEFEEAGKKLIRITDDGAGMSQEDAKLSVKRHSTSKISDFDDLLKLCTLGFRGEALYSISNVSRMKLITRTADSDSGYEMVIEGGKLLHSGHRGAPVGTTFEIKDLFFNVPARKKFMKADYTERAYLLHTVEELAISYYNIGFTVKGENKNLLSLPAGGKLSERIIDIFGAQFHEGLIYFESENSGYARVKGFVSKIEYSQPKKNRQHFFVNNRPVTNRMLTQALYDAYQDRLPAGRHPSAVIFLDIDPAAIDINVHPNKRVVKFSNEKEVYKLLLESLKSKTSSQEIPAIHLKDFENNFNINPVQVSENLKEYDYVSQSFLQDSFSHAEIPAGSGGAVDSGVAVLGQLFNTYILLQAQNGLIIIDQHAANERVLYEIFSEKKGNGKIKQAMLIPETIEVRPYEKTVLDNMLETIQNLGFDLELFGPNTYILKSYPSFFGEIKSAKEFLENFVELIITGTGSPEENKVEAPEEKIIRAACRAAVKARDTLSGSEIEQLVKDLRKCKQPLCCPHGRPTMINITLAELEKKFRR